MSDLAQKILATPGKLMKHSKDNVMLYEYEGKKYYVKTLPLYSETFKILLSFKLLEYMGVKIPNITTMPCFKGFDEDLYIFSEECGEKDITSLGEIPQDVELQKELAKIIYIADFLGLGDIANNNIIQSGNDLYLIDFELPKMNGFFRPLDPYGKMGSDDYSIARSFDLHNTKGNPLKIMELPMVGARTSLSLDEDSKREIEEKFFSLFASTREDGKIKLREIVDLVLEEQFPRDFVKDDLEDIIGDLSERCVQLSESKAKKEREREFIEIAHPQLALRQLQQILYKPDQNPQDDKVRPEQDKEKERDRAPERHFVKSYTASNHQIGNGEGMAIG